jgi:lysophospholipase L1-like esterase
MKQGNRETGKLFYFLIITNIITLILLTIISFHYKVPQKILIKVNHIGKNENRIDPAPVEYSGYIYARETIESLVYRRNKFDIVMLGDSLTCHNNWGELFDRDDVANFGIGGDTTDAIIRRINDINLVSPSKCFLMVGINDIFSGKSIEEITNNYEIIIKCLKENNIEIIIQSVLNISDLANNAWGYNVPEVNDIVLNLNKSLEEIAVKENIRYIDINILLRSGKNLNTIYTSGDGVHLNKKGYIIWGNELKKYL